jgi:hypothetical protein
VANKVVGQPRLQLQQEFCARHYLPALVGRGVVAGEPALVSVADHLSCPAVLELGERDRGHGRAGLVLQRDAAAELDDTVVAYIDAVVVVAQAAPDMEVVAGPELVLHAAEATGAPSRPSLSRSTYLLGLSNTGLLAWHPSRTTRWTRSWSAPTAACSSRSWPQTKTNSLVSTPYGSNVLEATCRTDETHSQPHRVGNPGPRQLEARVTPGDRAGRRPVREIRRSGRPLDGGHGCVSCARTGISARRGCCRFAAGSL